MVDTYKLQFNGNTITYPDNTVPICFNHETYPKRRYEYTIYDAGDGGRTSAGTVSMPFSAFDEIGIGAGYANFPEVSWTWFDHNAITANTGKNAIRYITNSENNYFVFVCTFVHNNSNNTFTVDKNGQNLNSAWMLAQTPCNTTGAWTAYVNNNSIKCVNKIVGVRYQ